MKLCYDICVPQFNLCTIVNLCKRIFPSSPLTKYFLKCNDFSKANEGKDGAKLTVAKCYKNLISDIWSKGRYNSLSNFIFLQFEILILKL